MIAVGCLVESAPVGLWVAERTRGELGEKAEEGFRKELRASDRRGACRDQQRQDD